MRRKTKVATAVVLVVALVASGIASVTRDKQRVVDWTLLGTEAQGRVLVIGFAGIYNGCTHSPRARVLGRSLDSVDLEVTAKGRNCKQQAAALLPPLRVRLGSPLDGQSVRGEGKSLRRFRPGLERRWSLGQPEVIGLLPGDAASVARTFNLEYREVGRDSAVGYLPVIAQRRIGDVLEVETRVSNR